jgi:hypothetical protein
METPEARIERQGRFADYVVAQEEWGELLNEVRDAVVGEWMNGATVEDRELAYAKIKALGLTHGLLKTWVDRKLSQEMVAEQEQSTPAL